MTAMLTLPRVALGCAPLAGLYGEVSEAQAAATVAAALERGITCFDTAPLYGAGLSERRLGAALRGVPRERLIISTKVGRLVRPDGSVAFDWSADGIRRSLAASLERLGLDRVDIVHLHDPDDHLPQVLATALPALRELRDQGVVRAIGAGMNQWPMLSRLLDTGSLDCVLLAGRYTLLEQEASAFLERCRSSAVSVLLGGIFNSGILATGPIPGAKYNYADAPIEILARVRRIEQACVRHGVALHTAALQFPLRNPAVTTIVVGAASPAEVGAISAALGAEVPAVLWETLHDENLRGSPFGRPLPRTPEAL